MVNSAKQFTKNLIYLFKNQLFVIVLTLALLMTSLFSSISVKAQGNNTTIQDTVSTSVQEPTDTYMNFNNDFIAQAELDHQKLIRNIFAISFFFVLIILIFTLSFYGGKIKKVSNIIVLQDEALKSTKDQLIKIINIFNYIDQQVYITDSKGIIEWINAYGTTFFTEKYEESKISLTNKFTSDNQAIINNGCDESKQIAFQDNLFGRNNQWKMIPVKNSKGEFSNMVFIS
jgi:transcriptional regulator with PAS, ATPase and Fis domain